MGIQAPGVSVHKGGTPPPVKTPPKVNVQTSKANTTNSKTNSNNPAVIKSQTSGTKGGTTTSTHQGGQYGKISVPTITTTKSNQTATPTPTATPKATPTTANGGNNNTPGAKTAPTVKPTQSQAQTGGQKPPDKDRWGNNLIDPPKSIKPTTNGQIYSFGSKDLIADNKSMQKLQGKSAALRNGANFFARLNTGNVITRDPKTGAVSVKPDAQSVNGVGGPNAKTWGFKGSLFARDFNNHTGPGYSKAGPRQNVVDPKTGKTYTIDTTDTRVFTANGSKPSDRQVSVTTPKGNNYEKVDLAEFARNVNGNSKLRANLPGNLRNGQSNLRNTQQAVKVEDQVKAQAQSKLDKANTDLTKNQQSLQQAQDKVAAIQAKVDRLQSSNKGGRGPARQLSAAQQELQAAQRKAQQLTTARDNAQNRQATSQKTLDELESGDHPASKAVKSAKTPVEDNFGTNKFIKNNPAPGVNVRFNMQDPIKTDESKTNVFNLDSDPTGKGRLSQITPNLAAGGSIKALGYSGSWNGPNIQTDGKSIKANLVDASGTVRLLEANGTAAYNFNDKLHTNVSANARGLVGAEGTLTAGANIDPSSGTYTVGAKAQAFAGAKAEGTISGGNDYFSASATGTASAGIGGEAGFEAGMKDGKLGIHADLHGALGLGLGVKFDVNVNVGKIANDLAQPVQNTLHNVENAASTAWNSVTSHLPKLW